MHERQVPPLRLERRSLPPEGSALSTKLWGPERKQRAQQELYQANRIFNDFVGDRSLPLAVFHDHFIGLPGGVAIFYVQTPEERDRLLDGDHLPGWKVAIHPMIFSTSPAGFDEQIAFTLRAYRDEDWETLQRAQRPAYGDPRVEAETARETEE